MNFFLKAAEIWLPDRDAARLSLGSSYYGEVPAFADASRDMHFSLGQGLPGQTWEVGHPLIWTDLDRETFMRSGAARDSGLSSAISIPVFGCDFLQAVLVLFFAGGEDLSGAVELWTSNLDNDSELTLLDGYYGDLERFEWISRRLTVMRGRGLPGEAWASERPVIIEDLGASNSFLRARNAAEAGITTGLALPMLRDGMPAHIVTLLSAKGTPIARRFEIWTVQPDGRLRFRDGYCDDGTDLHAEYVDVSYARGDGPMGLVWLTGEPRIGAFVNSAAGADEREQQMILLPVTDRQKMVAVVALGL